MFRRFPFLFLLLTLVGLLGAALTVPYARSATPQPLGLRIGDVWRIGEVDGSDREFGQVKRGYTSFMDAHQNPVIYTIGRSVSADWPFIHPSSHDSWAGGKAWTFSIKFPLALEPTVPFHLIIGALAIFEPSQINITVNGVRVQSRRLPDIGSGSELAFGPGRSGPVTPLAFDIPATALKLGENDIGITLDDGSWIIYDYVLLTKRTDIPTIPQKDLLKQFRQGVMSNITDIVFAERQPGRDGHWYANFSYCCFNPARTAYGFGGKLNRMNLQTGIVTTLLEDKQGGVRDPQVSYDGKKILFSYRKGGSPYYHLYEINTDGSRLKQLTDGPYDDIEPTYLPNGDLVFVSSRCNRWVNCWHVKVAVLYTCQADGSRIRPISSNNEQDNTPWPLPDGRLIYTRWEYVDRSQVDYHHLWSAAPDGVGQTVFYGNERPGYVMIDAKPVPYTDQVVASFSPGHGATEHVGYVAVVDPKGGPDDPSGVRLISSDPGYRDPWAFSADSFMASTGSSIVLMDETGSTQEIYRLSAEASQAGMTINEPRPIIAHSPERIIPSRVKPEIATGKLFLEDVYCGNSMQGVRRGDIKKLLVLESLPKPVNFTGGMEPLSYGGTFTLERILGEVPVEADGSAFMELPSLRSVFFVALDKNDMAVKRMQSFTCVQPGETSGCAGCHESRETAPAFSKRLMAMQRPASHPQPILGVPEVLDFPRDIQPVLDRSCVSCHNGDKRAGNADLTGDHGPMFSMSYFALTARSQVADGRNLARSNYAPRTIGSSASPMMAKLEPSHHGVKVTDREKKLVRLWIETGASYPGTYASLGSGMIGGYTENTLDRSDLAWPETKRGMDAMQRRCVSCHTGARALPLSVSDNLGRNPWEYMEANDPRRTYARHLLYNLSQPEKSLILRAPLSRAGGGLELCGGKNAPFAGAGDPDYRAILMAIRAASNKLTEIKRFDMPGFRPREDWIREMQNYGILSSTLPEKASIDYYAAETAYWRSLWYRPVPLRPGRIVSRRSSPVQ